MQQLRQPIYPVEPWTITESRFSIADNYRNETIFSLSNGYIGTRGTFEEVYGWDEETGLEGNFINGFYDSEAIRYGEWNYGFPESSQSLLNLPNAKAISIRLDDEIFSMITGTIRDYRRTLHLRDGYISRELEWQTQSGKRVRIEMKRLVSMTDKHLMAIAYTVTPLNFDGIIRFESAIDADVENHTRKTNPLVDYGPFGRRVNPERLETSGKQLYYQGRTKNTGLAVSCGCTHRLSGCSGAWESSSNGLQMTASVSAAVSCGHETTLEKLIIYASSREMDESELFRFVRKRLKSSEKTGFLSVLESQKAYYADFWDSSDVVIEGDDALQQGIRFNLFHLVQSAARDGRRGMGAKGLSGEGYEGHYFWDTEIYVMPVFTYTQPDIARKLLEYRYHTLDEARDRARVLGHNKGALYPWRTINGQEASTYFPLGTAQYHINADISYAVWQYIMVTDDQEFLCQSGAEILCETARVWADVGSFAEFRNGQYCICSVTGPDEYNAIVDNNFYTNLMARENLQYALTALTVLQTDFPDEYRRLTEKINLTAKEPGLWRQIVERMYFPYDENLRIYAQDDGFLQRKPWDESRIPVEKRHLLYENYHPLFIYRHRMAKQADAILGMYLNRHLFNTEELKQNYDYYQTVTLHHSSLSTCIFGIAASGIGYHDEAYQYFIQSARMDLDDYHNNVYAGIHAANMAGTWQAIVNGFAGLQTGHGGLKLTPNLPIQWHSCQFKIKYRSCQISVLFTREKLRLELIRGDRLSVMVGSKEILLKQGEVQAVETISGDFF